MAEMEEDVIGGYRTGDGRSYLAWYFGYLEGAREETHQSFSNKKRAEKWLLHQASNDPDAQSMKCSVWRWEYRQDDGARLLIAIYEIYA